MIGISEFLLFCFAVTGMTLILVQGVIFESFRLRLARSVKVVEWQRSKKNLPRKFTFVEFLNKMIQCPQCTGFWCGLFCGLFIVSCDIVSCSCSILVNELESFWSGFLGVSTYFVYFVIFCRWLILLFCCGVAGSFLAPFGDLLLQWIFISKELTTKKLLPENHHQIIHTETEENQ
jgi:hypothetical protein